MSETFAGSLNGAGMRMGIVVARFNGTVTSSLLDGARDGLTRLGVSADAVDVAWTPGCFEIPLVARRMADSGRYDAVICLGAVIRGETPHFEYVAEQAATGIGRVGLDTGVPVIFGVLTTETLEQAINRAGAKAGNKGFDAALTAVEMASLLRAIRPD
ncbi:MAG: 6,7-dimethyl-8-ribityllumazine synthase [Dehalococcoidia bacterium]